MLNLIPLPWRICLAVVALGLVFGGGYDFGRHVAQGESAQKQFDQALAYAQGIDISHVTVFAYGCQAYMSVRRGRFREAYALCQELLQSSEIARSRHILSSLMNRARELRPVPPPRDEQARPVPAPDRRHLRRS